jgi:hypothetical protein
MRRQRFMLMLAGAWLVYFGLKLIQHGLNTEQSWYVLGNLVIGGSLICVALVRPLPKQARTRTHSESSR